MYLGDKKTQGFRQIPFQFPCSQNTSPERGLQNQVLIARCLGQVTHPHAAVLKSNLGEQA